MKKLLLILSLIIAAPSVTEAIAAPRMEMHDRQSSLEVTPRNGSLELSVSHDHDAPARFTVYSITGQMVKSVEVHAGQTVTVDLPTGYYIVKTADWSKRVLVS